MFVLIGYAVACIIFSIAFNPIIVLVGFFGLRFFGQGLMGHTSVSTMARAFESDRGKAISIATLGHPLGEVTLPLIVATGIALIGWRSTLQVSALSLLLLVLPISLYLLQNQSRDLLVPTGDQGSTEGKKSNPYLLLKNRTFWIIAPSVFMLGFLNTAIFFFQIKIGYSRGWEPSWVAASLSAYAVVNALSMLTSGPLVDKFSARRMFPFMMIPYCVGMLVLAFWTHPFSYPVALALFGASNGSGSTVRNALYAEVFGKDRIGAVRSFFSMVIVFSTALGPLSYGLLLDAGWTYASIFILSAALILATVIWSFRLSDQGE